MCCPESLWNVYSVEIIQTRSGLPDLYKGFGKSLFLFNAKLLLAMLEVIYLISL